MTLPDETSDVKMCASRTCPASSTMSTRGEIFYQEIRKSKVSESEWITYTEKRSELCRT